MRLRFGLPLYPLTMSTPSFLPDTSVLPPSSAISTFLTGLVTSIANLVGLPFFGIAVIVTVPLFFAVTCPFELMVATDLLELLHSLIAVFPAESVTFLPTAIRSEPVITGAAFSTWIVQVSLLLNPSALAAVIVALPSETSVTFPSSSTSATASLELLHLISPGSSVIASPTKSAARRRLPRCWSFMSQYIFFFLLLISIGYLSSSRHRISTFCLVRIIYTSNVSYAPPPSAAFAVIVTVPFFRIAVIFPLSSTETALLLELDHLTALFSASLPPTSALSCMVLPVPI